MAMFGNRRQSTLGDLLANAIQAHAQTAQQAAHRPAPRAVARTYRPPVSERIGNALAPLIGREGGHSLGNLLRDWTPIGNIEGVAADPSLRSPNALLSALPIPGPARRGLGRAADELETVFRGVSTVSPRTGNYYTGDREWARQFTQSGRDHEILQRQIARGDIYEAPTLPRAVNEQEMDAAIAEARRRGLKAIRVNEGQGEPTSIFVIDRTALR